MFDVFCLILQKLIPLYGLIGLGFIAGRYLRVPREAIANLLIYIMTPAVIFHALMRATLAYDALSLPAVFYILCSGIALAHYQILGFVYRGAAKNILSFSAGTANTGYFGLPVALYLFGENSLGLVILASFGFILFENTLGFYLTARSHFTARQSLRRLLRLPSLYAFLLALTLRSLNISLPPAVGDLGMSFRGAYTILGMMMIGLGIAGLSRFKIDFKFTGIAFFSRFVVWPLAVGILITLDRQSFHFYSPQIHQVILLMGSVPLAANVVAYASALDAEPEKAAIAVLLSTFFALGFIPLMMAW